EKNIPMSNLIIQALKKYMKDIDNSIITLVIKKNEESNMLSEYKKIKFKGKEITTTNNIYNDDKTPKCACLIPKLDVKDNSELIHQYTFYKTEKGKLLVYIRKIHMMIVYNFNGTQFDIVEEECDYKVFNDIKEAMKVFYDIPQEYIDDLIFEVAETEVLDI
ncbi:hypothetical protein, partial [Faecalibacillus intestinalis]